MSVILTDQSKAGGKSPDRNTDVSTTLGGTPTPSMKLGNLPEVGNPMAAEMMRPSLEREAEEKRQAETYRREKLDITRKNFVNFEDYHPEVSEEVRKRALIKSYMLTQYDVDPSGLTAYRIQRDAIARTEFGRKADGSDESLFSRLQGRALNGKETSDFMNGPVTQQAVLSTLAGENGLAGFMSENAENPVVRRDREAVIDLYEATEDALTEQYGEALPEIKTTWSAMNSADGTGTWSWRAQASAAYKRLEGDEEAQTNYLHGLRELSVAYPTPEIQNALFETGFNVHQSAVRGAGEAAWKAVHGLGSLISTYETTFSFAAMLDSENAAKAKKFAEFRRGEIDFVEDVKNIYRSEYDPVRPLAKEGSKLRAIEEGLYAMPGAVTTTGIAMIPVIGMPATFGMMSEFSRQKYRQRFLAEGIMSRSDAALYGGILGNVAAVPNMFIERLQGRLFLGKNKMFKRIMAKSDAVITNRLLRGVVRFSASSSTETSQELLQGLVDESVQDIAHEFEKEIPDVAWKNGKDGVFDGYFNKAITTFVAVGPLSIGTAMRGLSAEERAKQFKGAPSAVKKAAGFREEDIDAVDKAEGPGAAVAAVGEAMENRDPYSEESKTANEDLDAKIKAQQKAVKVAMQEGVLPSIRAKAGKETVDVYDAESGETILEDISSAEAAKIVGSYLDGNDTKRQGLVDSLVSQVQGSQTLLEERGEGTKEIEPFKTMTEAMAGEEFDGAAERIAHETSLMEQVEGGDGSVSRTTIFGASIPFGYRGRAEQVDRTYAGSSLFSSIHEHTHETRRRLMETGAFTREEQVAEFQRLDTFLAATSIKEFRDGKQVEVSGEKLRFMPANFAEIGTRKQDIALDEAMSQIAEVLVLRTRNGKKSKFRELLNNNISAQTKLGNPTAGKLKAFARAMREWFGLNLRRSQAIKRLEREGKLDSTQLDTLSDRILGKSPQEHYEEQVKDEVDKLIVDQEDGSKAEVDVPFSIGSTQDPVTYDKAGNIIPLSKRFDESRDEISFAISPADVAAHRTAYEEVNKRGAELEESITYLEDDLLKTGGNLRGNPDIKLKARWEELWGERKRPEPGVIFQYNGHDAWITEDGERVTWEGGYSDPVSWVDKRLISAELLAELRGKKAQNEADLYLALEEFDPGSDARKKDAVNIRRRDLSKQAAAFAALLDERDVELKHSSSSFVTRVWQSLAKHDEIFQYGRTDSKDAGKIAEAVSTPGRKVTAEDNGDTVDFKNKNGRLQIHNVDLARPYISAMDANSQGRKRGGGAQLYQAALDWIHNNGKRIKDDPAGITSINYVRRTSNFVASAVRHRTTKHLNPSSDQSVGKWTKSDILNMSLLFRKEVGNVFSAIPDAQNWTYDFKSGNFKNDGKKISRKSIEKAVLDADPRQSGIGISTLQRAVITASAVQEFQRGSTADSLLAEKLPRGLEGVSYSVGQARMADIIAGDALSRVRDPEARANIMLKMSDNLAKLRREKDEIKRAFGKDYTQKAIADPRKKKSLKKESAMREAMRREELEDVAEAKYANILEQEELAKLKEQPVHGYLSKVSDPLHGELMSRSQAIKKDKSGLQKNGDYDGADGVSRTVFGGDTMPDQAAQELYNEGLLKEPTVGALWDALEREQNSVTNRKEELKQGKEAMRNARTQAKQESSEWLADAEKQQELDNNPMARVRRALAMLDAMLTAMPPELRGKVGGYLQIAKLNSDEARVKELEKRMEKADVVVEKWIREEVKKDIGKLFEKGKVKKTNKGVPKAKLAADFTDQVQRIQELSNRDAKQVDDRIQELQATMLTETDQENVDAATAEMIELMAFGNIAGMNSDQLMSFRENLQSVVNKGVMVKEAIDEESKAEADQLIETVNHDVTGGGGSLTSSEAKKRNEISWAVKNMTKFHRENVSWEWLINGLARANKDVGTLESETHEKLATMVHVATEDEKRENMRVDTEFNTFMSSIYGGKKGMKLSRAVAKMADVEHDTGVMRMDYGAKGKTTKKTTRASNVLAVLEGTADAKSLGFSKADFKAARQEYLAMQKKAKNGVLKGNRVVKYQSENKGRKDNLSLSQGQAINLTMLYRQEGLRESMEEEGYSPGTMKQMEDFLTPEAKQVRDWLSEKYESNHGVLNKFFKVMNGVSLPKIKWYSPARRKAQGREKNMEIDSRGNTAMSTGPDFFISRITNFAQVDQTADAFSIYKAHMSQSSHYIAWAKTMKQLRTIFGNTEVKKNIDDYTGDSMLQLINQRMEWFADGGNRAAKYTEWLDKMNKAVTYSDLAWNWGVGIKQTASISGYAFDMGFKDFKKYSKKFMKHPIDNLWEMWYTPYVQTRFKQGYERDVIEGLKNEGGWIQRSLQSGMIFGKIGDIIPVMIGGWISRQNAYEKEIAKGKGEEEAMKIATIKFEMATARAQQSGDLKDLSTYQAGDSLYKLATKYQTSLRQYYANVSEAGLDFKAGKKGSGKEFARRAFIAQIILPVTFQFMGDLLKSPLNDDDEEDYDPFDYVRAMLLGPLNGLFLVGDGFELLGSGLAGTKIWETNIEVLDGITGISYGINDLKEGDILKGADGIAQGIGRTSPGIFTFFDIMRRETKKFGITD